MWPVRRGATAGSGPDDLSDDDGPGASAPMLPNSVTPAVSHG